MLQRLTSFCWPCQEQSTYPRPTAPAAHASPNQTLGSWHSRTLHGRMRIDPGLKLPDSGPPRFAGTQVHDQTAYLRLTAHKKRSVSLCSSAHAIALCVREVIHCGGSQDIYLTSAAPQAARSALLQGDVRGQGCERGVVKDQCCWRREAILVGNKVPKLDRG